MPRLRAFILGILLIAAVLAGTEYVLQRQAALVPGVLRSCDPLCGWQPSTECYLEAPSPQKIEYVSGDAKIITLNYDENGFRQNELSSATAGIGILCLGSERVLAPDVPAAQTFVAQWQSLRTTVDSSAGSASPAIVNGGLPDGCPLLWSLHAERLQVAAGSHWFCFIGPETLSADFRVRRATKFNSLGQPVSASHPHTSTTAADESAHTNPLKRYQLTQQAVPWIMQLFLGENPQTLGDVSAMTQTNPIVRVSGNAIQARFALEPLLVMKDFVASKGGRLILVYLPGREELHGRSGGTAASPTDFRQIVQQFATSQQILYLDLTSTLTNAVEQDLFTAPLSCLTPAGHQLVAQTLENSFFPPMAKRESGSTPTTNGLESPDIITR